MPSWTDRSMWRLRAWIPLLGAAVFLSGCGGGGGSGGVLYNQWGLRTIKADRAYARLEAEYGTGTAPGSGQTLGAVDTGIDTGHPVFEGKMVTEEFLSGAGDESGDKFSHGTAVASVMAGRPSDGFAEEVKAPRGVAWGADITMFAVPTGVPGTTYRPISLAVLASVDSRWATSIDTVTGWSSGGRSLDFVNLSVGFLGIIEQYSTQQLRDNFSRAIAAMAQSGATEKTVFVWAAGNAHGRTCDPADFTSNSDLCVNAKVNARSVQVLPGLAARIPELQGHLIAVVAIGSNGGIAPFSNRCGIAEDWCIAAPGVDVRLAYFGPDPDDPSEVIRGAGTDSGTSYAAPMVTGGLAVMKHYFRDQMSNTELVTRLLKTANKTGIYDDTAVYGQGLLDLDAATTPVGTTTIALGGRVDGSGSNLEGTRFTPGLPLGNGLARALAGHEIAAFDSLGAPFWFRLGDLAGAAAGRSMHARLRAFAAAPGDDPEPGVLRPRTAALAGGDRLSLGIMQAPAPGSDGGHLSLAGRALAIGGARDGLRIAAFSTEGLRGENPASGATLSWRPAGVALGLTGGWVAERETVLGSGAAGAFGRLSGSSAFAGIEGSARIGSWRLGAGAEIGTVRAAAQGGMLASISPLTTSAFAVKAETRLAYGDGLTVLAGAAAPRRGRAGQAHGSGRPHQGGWGAAPLALRRS